MLVVLVPLHRSFPPCGQDQPGAASCCQARQRASENRVRAMTLCSAWALTLVACLMFWAAIRFLPR